MKKMKMIYFLFVVSSYFKLIQLYPAEAKDKLLKNSSETTINSPNGKLKNVIVHLYAEHIATILANSMKNASSIMNNSETKSTKPGRINRNFANNNSYATIQPITNAPEHKTAESTATILDATSSILQNHGMYVRNNSSGNKSDSESLVVKTLKARIEELSQLLNQRWNAEKEINSDETASLRESNFLSLGTGLFSNSTVHLKYTRNPRYIVGFMIFIAGAGLIGLICCCGIFKILKRMHSRKEKWNTEESWLTSKQRKKTPCRNGSVLLKWKNQVEYDEVLGFLSEDSDDDALFNKHEIVDVQEKGIQEPKDVGKGNKPKSTRELLLEYSEKKDSSSSFGQSRRLSQEEWQAAFRKGSIPLARKQE